MSKCITLLLALSTCYVGYGQIKFDNGDLGTHGIGEGSVAFADVDGDSDMDVLITGQSSSGKISELYKNDGSGNFSLVTGTPFKGVYDGSIAFADVDGDSDMDVLITGQSSSGRMSELYKNNGSGNFSLVTGTPFKGVFRSSIAFADVDGDSDMDVLITGYSSSVPMSELYKNDGSGNFSLVTGTPFTGVSSSSIGFADVDGDSDMDVLITGQSSSYAPISELYKNDGSGNYSLVTGTPFKGVDNGSIAFADVDGDSDMDVLITGSNSSNAAISELYKNDSSGNFSLVTGTPFTRVSYSSIAFADVDGDSDMDVLITGDNYYYGRISELYKNDGSGNYSLVTGTPFKGVAVSFIAFADVDGDSDMDVLITGNDSSNAPISELYKNDGGGNYSMVKSTPFTGVSSSSIAFADVDGDSDMDVLITGNDSSNAPISELYKNDGGGNYNMVKSTPFTGVFWSSIAFADVDGDSDMDVLTTGRNSSNAPISELYKNDGSGNFSLVTGTPFKGVKFSSIAFADVDGDSDMDVLITGESSNSKRISELYKNDGSGNFSLVTGTPFKGVAVSSIAFADVDGDSDMDLLITGSSSLGPISELYKNDGSGNFSLVTGTPFKGVGYSSIAFADVDGDNDMDVLITGRNSSNAPISELYKNDGSGNFSLVTGTPFTGVYWSSIAFADVDGDSDMDVLITGPYSSNAPISELYKNDGSGNFSLVTGTPFTGVYWSSIAFADVDGDSDMDVFITGGNFPNAPISELYKNESQKARSIQIKPSVNHESCGGDGSVFANAKFSVGTVGPVGYEWKVGNTVYSTDTFITNLSPNRYTFRVTDSLSGNVVYDTFDIINVNSKKVYLTNLAFYDKKDVAGTPFAKYFSNLPENINKSFINPLNLLNPGNNVRFKIECQNNQQSGQSIVSGKCIIRTEDPYLTIIDSSSGLNNVAWGGKAWSTDEFEVLVDPSAPKGYEAIVEFVVKEGTNEWRTTCIPIPLTPLDMNRPACLIDDDNNPDSKGNDNDKVEPNETIEFLPFVNNLSGLNAEVVRGRLTNLDNIPEIKIWDKKTGISGEVVAESWWNYSFNNPNPIPIGGQNMQPQFDFVFDYNYTKLYEFDLHLLMGGGFKLFGNVDTALVMWSTPYTFNEGSTPAPGCGSFSVNITGENESAPGEYDGYVEANPVNGLSPYTYEWDQGGTTKKIENLTEGTYIVRVTDSLGCIVYGSKKLGGSLSIRNPNSKSTFTLYPNPSTGEINIKRSSTEVAQLEVYNALGKLIYAEQISGEISSFYLLQSGIYFVKIKSQDNKTEHAQKIIISN